MWKTKFSLHLVLICRLNQLKTSRCQFSVLICFICLFVCFFKSQHVAVDLHGLSILLYIVFAIVSTL